MSTDARPTSWPPTDTLPLPLSELPTPALLVDVQRLDMNITAMADRITAAGVALRPHFKTSKCWQVARRQLAAGAVGFTCSTPAEVTFPQSHGVRDLLWAHAPVGPRKVDSAVAASADGGLLLCVDSVEVCRPLSERAASVGVGLRMLLEVNTGHARVGVEPGAAVTAADGIATLPNVRLGGVLTHEGHVGRFVDDHAALAAAGTQAAQTLVGVAQALRAAGHPAPNRHASPRTPRRTTSTWHCGIPDGALELT